MNATTVHAFRLFAPGDPCDPEFQNWSRIYEYPGVLTQLAAMDNGGRLRIHNTAAGGEFACHCQFMERLATYDTLNTDLVQRPGVSFHDIREPRPEWSRSFDAVLAVSAIEHLPPDEQRIAVENLARQVKPGGRLILTFDIPGMDLDFLQEMAGRRIARPAVPLNGANSRFADAKWEHLNVGLLSLSVGSRGEWGFAKVVFSKQADHDADLAPFWLRWYREVFGADEILVTPVKTPGSEITRTVAFYEAAGCRVCPIMLPGGWNDTTIWRRQLDIVREILPQGEWMAVSADADQLFELPTAMPAAETATPFRRLQLVAEGPSRLGVFDESGRGRSYVGAFVGSLRSSSIGVTGHWRAAAPAETVPAEFHLHLRGLKAFCRKTATVHFDKAAARSQGYHWRDQQAIAQAEGSEGLARLYARLVADYLFEDAWPPALRAKLERLRDFLWGGQQHDR